MSGEWTEWLGGECPVDGRALVDIKFRPLDSEADDAVGTGYTGRLVRWWHDGSPGDVIAYRLAGAPAPSKDTALSTQPGGTHYKDCAIQPVQYIEANRLRFLEGCIVKRATRHDKPTGKGREDLEKIIHEARLILELRYGGEVVA